MRAASIERSAASVGRLPETPPRRLLHVFPTFDIGGAQARFAQIANHFGSAYEHLIVALDGRTQAGRLLAPHVKVELVPVEYDKRRPLHSLRRFRQALGRLPHDILLTYNWGAMDWAVANRLRGSASHIHMEDGFGPDDADRQLARRVWYRRLALTGRRTVVVVPSQTLWSIARGEWRLADHRLRHIPNGIDCQRFRPAATAAPPDRELVIGTVATLRAEKNIARLVDAFAIARRSVPTRLLIVGDGPERAALERQVANLELGDAVEFSGGTPYPEAFYRRMDLFALSSDTEQMPYCILEAMASGIAVVATAVGDVAQLVSDVNRPFVVAERSAEVLADKLAILARDAGMRRRVGAANRAAAIDRYDVATMLARYRALYDEPRLAAS